MWIGLLFGVVGLVLYHIGFSYYIQYKMRRNKDVVILDRLTFRYSPWSKLFECTIWLVLLAPLVYYLITMSNAVRYYTLVYALAMGIVLYGVHRMLAWRSQEVILVNYQLMYFKKGIREQLVTLDHVDRVDVRLGRFRIQYRNGMRVWFPRGFEHSWLLYKILTEHRSRPNYPFRMRWLRNK